MSADSVHDYCEALAFTVSIRPWPTHDLVKFDGNRTGARSRRRWSSRGFAEFDANCWILWEFIVDGPDPGIGFATPLPRSCGKSTTVLQRHCDSHPWRRQEREMASRLRRNDG